MANIVVDIIIKKGDEELHRQTIDFGDQWDVPIPLIAKTGEEIRNRVATERKFNPEDITITYQLANQILIPSETIR